MAFGNSVRFDITAGGLTPKQPTFGIKDDVRSRAIIALGGELNSTTDEISSLLTVSMRQSLDDDPNLRVSEAIKARIEDLAREYEDFLSSYTSTFDTLVFELNHSTIDRRTGKRNILISTISEFESMVHSYEKRQSTLRLIINGGVSKKSGVDGNM